MEIVMCTGCFNLYNKKYLNTEEKHCPLPECGKYDKLMEIDELIARPIQILNRKGYRTLYCCSGHYGLEKYNKTPLAYIMFNCNTIPTTYPEGWHWGELCGHKHSIETTGEIDYFDSIRNLYKWVEELPKINKEIANDN